MDARREPSFLLASPERRVLRWIAGRLPGWVRPDDLTALGVLSALGICVAYQLSNHSLDWLWVASGLLVLQWLGDSLDGTLARVRKIERPTYGYYLDHLVDAISTAAIGIGLGLSPLMLLSIGTLIVVAYLILSINVYLESFAFGRFSIGYGFIGPTEVRIILVVLNTLFALGAGLGFRIADLGLTVVDVVGLAVAAAMVILLVSRAAKNLRQLARMEPPAPRRSRLSGVTSLAPGRRRIARPTGIRVPDSRRGDRSPMTTAHELAARQGDRAERRVRSVRNKADVAPAAWARLGARTGAERHTDPASPSPQEAGPSRRTMAAGVFGEGYAGRHRWVAHVGKGRRNGHPRWHRPRVLGT